MFSPLVLEHRDPDWVLVIPLRWRGIVDEEEIEIVVPAKFPTDLASIPPILWGFWRPWGPWAKAAAVHDWLYFGDRSRGRAFADRVFWIMMEGVSPFPRFMFWLAVRSLGWIWWNEWKPGEPIHTIACE